MLAERCQRSPTEAPAHPGSKNCFLLEQELEDPELLRKALERTESVLPLPKPKPPIRMHPVAQGKIAKRSKPRKPESAA